MSAPQKPEPPKIAAPAATAPSTQPKAADATTTPKPKMKLSELQHQQSTDMGDMIDITNKPQYLAEMKDAGERLVVVAVLAKWCDNCQLIEPVFFGFSRTYPDVVLLKVDIEVAPDVVALLGVKGQPVFLFFRKEKKIDSYQGADAKALKKKFEAHVDFDDAPKKSCCIIL